MTNIQELEKKISEANKHYRNDEPILTDTQYDALVEQLIEINPESPLLSEVGGEDLDISRKSKLPIPMFSLNKIKTIDEIYKWFKSKNIPLDTELILTPKFDGASLCVKEKTKQAWTRGNGIEGQASDEHLAKLNTGSLSDDIITFGEVIIKRQTFLDKYKDIFSNPRNLVAGQLNHKTPNDILKDIDFIRFGVVGKDFETRKVELDYLNKNQSTIVNYKIVTIDELSENYLKELFLTWSTMYEIDGIVVEVNSMKLRDSLGRETSNNNPVYTRAYKGRFETVKETTILDIVYDISKNGLLKPVAIVEPTELDGAVVSRVTLNNAKFVKNNDLGVGSIFSLKRSGGVIPLLVEVKYASGFEMPIMGSIEIGWNENGVELITLSETPQQRLKQLISFFEIMGVDQLGEGILKHFYIEGYDTVKKILSMTKEDMLLIPRFAEKKANNILESINSKRELKLNQLMHGSGKFINLGSKKLVLLEDLYNYQGDNLREEIINREGFSEISADNYLNGIEEYRAFEKDLEGLITVSITEEVVAESNDLEGMVFVFTGVRDKLANEAIENRGGKIVSSVSKNSTHLIMKAKGSNSAKELKSIELGQTIWTLDELWDFLG